MARKKKDGHFLTCYLSQTLFDKLTEYSEKSMMPKTSVIETALKKYFDEISLNEKHDKSTDEEV